ncbi:response regulator [Pseudoalteromonas sp. SSDWG2]|uniref:response regulator n=1 Tax=Pseudoalteromonas sp. SSDWG2 TaxID=3139391 RepID=UPI003BAD3C79
MAKLVLTIDDNKVIHHLVEDALNGVAQVIHAKDGEQGVKQALKHNPDIILLDVEMPGMDGYAVCKALKEDPKTHTTPILFLSGRGDLEERMRGYNAGADDYIIKPFNSDELKARIAVLYQYKKRSQELEHEVSRAQSTAELAMTDSGDMGRVMRYVSQTYGAHDVKTLSEYFFAFFEPMNLDVVVAFWLDEGEMFFANHGAECPLEQELLEQHRHSQRFVDFDDNTIVNYPKVSLLVKNMPMEDSALYGRYKDLFPHLLEATHAKVQDMENSNSALRHAAMFGEAFNTFEHLLVQHPDIKDNPDLVQFISLHSAQIHTLRCDLVESIEHFARPESVEDVSSQTDIELF